MEGVLQKKVIPAIPHGYTSEDLALAFLSMETFVQRDNRQIATFHTQFKVC
jgi:hypothetical protein